MSYIVNTNNFAENFVPPKKRSAQIVAWCKVLVFPLQVLYDTLFGTYKDGNTASDWDVSTAYTIGNQVRYIDKSIYQCYVANTGNIPTNTSYWFKVQDKFVGIIPRMQYNSQHIVLEWALNEWFGTTFVNSPGASDIFITKINIFDTTFWVGATENESSLVTYNNVDTFGWIQAEDLTAIDYYFTINVPIAVWTALDSVSANRDKIIRAFADTYVLAGVKYNIITYI
jgi:hypothetical protein